MTPQTIFNLSISGLIKQGKQAINSEGRCQYRAPDGSKCAVGLLIQDEHYLADSESLEVTDKSYTQSSDPVYLMCKASGIDLESRPIRDLLMDLQIMHDDYFMSMHNRESFVEYIERKSFYIAEKHALTPLAV